MNEPKHTISICMGSSCAARGNMVNLSRIRDYLRESGIEADVALRGALCSNACTTGPNMTIDGTEHHGVEPGSLDDLLVHHFGR